METSIHKELSRAYLIDQPVNPILGVRPRRTDLAKCMQTYAIRMRPAPCDGYGEENMRAY